MEAEKSRSLLWAVSRHRRARGVSSCQNLKSWEDWVSVQARKQKRVDSSFLSLLVLFKSSILSLWGYRGRLPALLSELTEMLISSRNTLTNLPKNNVYLNAWAPEDPVRLTHKSTHPGRKHSCFVSKSCSPLSSWLWWSNNNELALDHCSLHTGKDRFLRFWRLRLPATGDRSVRAKHCLQGSVLFHFLCSSGGKLSVSEISRGPWPLQRTWLLAISNTFMQHGTECFLFTVNIYLSAYSFLCTIHFNCCFP